MPLWLAVVLLLLALGGIVLLEQAVGRPFGAAEEKSAEVAALFLGRQME